MAIDWDSFVLAPVMAAFGQTVVYTQGSSTFSLLGVFDRYHVAVEIDPVQGVPVSTLKPILGVRLGEFPIGFEPKQRDSVVIGTEKWLVVDTQPDGHGHIKLILKLVK